MDPVFALVLALEAIPIGLVTFADRPGRGRAGSGLLGRGSLKGFNGCDACGAPLALAADAPWRLRSTCIRCGTTQAWASAEVWPVGPPLEAWTPIERADPSKRRFAPRTLPARTVAGTPKSAAPAAGTPGATPRTAPGAPQVPTSRRIAARGTPARGMPPQGAPPRDVPPRPVPARPAPVPPPVRPTRPTRDGAIADPFILDPAARARGPFGGPDQRPVHRPRPVRRGFRRDNAMSRVSAVLGQRGYNCCDACGDPLPREPDREWRYAGTCPRCGQVQIWAT